MVFYKINFRLKLAIKLPSIFHLSCVFVELAELGREALEGLLLRRWGKGTTQAGKEKKQVPEREFINWADSFFFNTDLPISGGEKTFCLLLNPNPLKGGMIWLDDFNGVFFYPVIL